jgi:hydrogenase maturation factor HypF (carbamoyltransferase family)
MTTYKWVPTGNKPLLDCVNCGGEYEELVVEPDRSKTYLRRILLCKRCKGIFGVFPQPPKP